MQDASGHDASRHDASGHDAEDSAVGGRDATSFVDAPSAPGDGGDAARDLDAERPTNVWHGVAVGDAYVCALRGSDSTTYCAGTNDWGQLGNGEVSMRGDLNAPLVWSAVKSETAGVPFSGVDTIAAAEQHTCAAKAGTIYCWGRSDSWESGSKMPLVTQINPVVQQGVVPGGVFEISSGGQHVCVRAANGAFCWGSNESSQISGAFKLQLVELAELPVPTNPKRLALGENFSLAITEDDTVVCWGLSRWGQCGVDQGTPCRFSPIDDCVATPQPIPSLPRASEIAAGDTHSCAIGLLDKKVRCWGQNDYGKVGTAPLDSCVDEKQCEFGPTEVALVEGADRLALGIDHSCALLQGEVWCWGESSSLGRDLPPKVSLPTPDRVLNQDGEPLIDIVDIAANYTETCARDTHGDILCWGSRFTGRAILVPWPNN